MRSMSFIVTMSMKSEEVVRSVVSSVPISVVDLYHIFICEKQSTPSAPSILPLQRFGQCSGQEWVCSQSLAPIEEVSVIRTRSTLDFDVSPDVRITVPAEFGALWRCEHPVAVSLSSPVFTIYPLTSLVGVPKS